MPGETARRDPDSGRRPALNAEGCRVLTLRKHPARAGESEKGTSGFGRPRAFGELGSATVSAAVLLLISADRTDFLTARTILFGKWGKAQTGGSGRRWSGSRGVSGDCRRGKNLEKKLIFCRPESGRFEDIGR
jgi:hypothetical protein